MILKLYLEDKLAGIRDKDEFVESGQHDILTEALGELEYLGRVRTISKYVTQQEVF